MSDAMRDEAMRRLKKVIDVRETAIAEAKESIEKIEKSVASYKVMYMLLLTEIIEDKDLPQVIEALDRGDAANAKLDR